MPGCGDDSEEAAAQGGGSASGVTTGSAAPTTSTSTSTSDGGAPGSGGEGGGGPTSSSGGQPTCDGAVAGAPCDVEGTVCEDSSGQSDCEGGWPSISACVGGKWDVWSAITCGPFTPEPTCTVPGRYLVATSGPFEPEEDSFTDVYGGPFEVAFEVREDGRLYVSASNAWLEPGTCDVVVYWTLDDDCYEESGGTFCETVDRTLHLTMTDDPATGTVELECSGECEITTAAPVTATRQ